MGAPAPRRWEPPAAPSSSVVSELFGGGCRKKPGPKPRKNPAARPLAGGEVLVAVVGPSPERGEGKN